MTKFQKQYLEIRHVKDDFGKWVWRCIGRISGTQYAFHDVSGTPYTDFDLKRKLVSAMNWTYPRTSSLWATVIAKKEEQLEKEQREFFESRLLTKRFAMRKVNDLLGGLNET